MSRPNRRPGRFRALRRGLKTLKRFVVPSESERAETSSQVKGWRKRWRRVWGRLRRLRLSRFGSAWRRCRQSAGFYPFLLGLPAVAATLATFGFAFEVATTSKAETAVRYLIEGDTRFRANDYPAARACYERLFLINPSSEETRYRLAMSLEALNEPGRVAGIMKGLAPPGRPGYAPAHFWLARRALLAQPPSYRDAESHLKALMEVEPGSDEGRALLGQLYGATGRNAEAEAALEDVVADRPDLLLLLAQTCRLQGKAPAAERWANEAAKHYGGLVRDHPEGAQARTWLALSECYFGRFERAEAILLEGRDGSDDPPLLRHSLSQVYATWIDALRREKRGTIGLRLALLERGLRQNPNDPGLLQRLASAVESGGAEADRARDALETVLATGQAGGIAHMILGLDAQTRGQAEQAAVHWERAYQISPESPSIANNLAWALATGPRPNLPRALSLIDRVLERAPDETHFRDTRGFILLRMKRWKDALPDLEAALLAAQPRPELHRALAEVYDHLNLPGIAAKHRLQAEAAARPGP